MHTANTNVVDPCRVATGEADSLWGCACPECAQLQHEASDPDTCNCPLCEPDDWVYI